MKRVVWLILLSAVSAGAVMLWRSSEKGKASSYETMILKKGSIESTVAAIGTLQPILSVDVGAQVSGQIIKIHVQPGQIVEKDQLLVEIDPQIPQAAVEAGRAAIADLRAQILENEAVSRQTVLQHQRLQELSESGAASREQLESAHANAQVAEAKLEQLKAQIAQRESTLRGDEAQLGYTRIYAPISGTVISVDAKVGQTLNATYQTPLVLRVADLSRMTVWTDVAEADIRNVKEGMSATFTTLGDETRRWKGNVRQILHMPPTAESADAPKPEFGKVIYYTVLFDVDNADKQLRPRMTTQVSIQTQSASDVLISPLAALTPLDDKPGHWDARVLLAGEKVENRQVKTGTQDRKSAEVLEGLAEGEILIMGEAADTTTKRFIW